MKYHTIILEFVGGTDILTAISEAIDLAKEKSCIVRFNFNGINLYVDSELTVNEIHSIYKYLLKN
jgi:hypothetical protein